jgi:ABC-2 type transport system ATP-binding protein
MRAPDAALEIQGLGYAYTRSGRALDTVSLTVPEGSFTALLGPNGAGKTTLMSLVTRLFESREGRIRVGGVDLKAQPRKALAAMGVVFQRPTLDIDLTVAQNMRYAAALHGLAPGEARRRTAATLERLGMADKLKAPVRTLSGGMRRRVELARALLHEPRLLILDEPTVGLDIASRRGIVEHVHELCRERGLAVLWATHLIDEIWPGDRVVLIDNGRIRASGSIEEVLSTTGEASLGEAYRHLTAAKAA